MDLFSAAGIDVGDGGRSGRAAVPRTLRVPLLNYKVVAEARKLFTFDPSDRQKVAAADYAKLAKSPRFAKQKETSVRQLFTEKVLGEILGYQQMGAEGAFSLAFEQPIRSGAVDVALGRFGLPDGKHEIIAPFELKGPTTTDLDAIMPGRGRSPVQQGLCDRRAGLEMGVGIELRRDQTLRIRQGARCFRAVRPAQAGRGRRTRASMPAAVG
jgi:hypothetical protein